MTLIFAPNWQDWDVNKQKRHNLKTAINANGVGTAKQYKNLAYEQKNKALRKEGAIFLQMTSEPDIRAAIQRATSNFNNTPPVNELLTDAVQTAYTVTISQGSHQAEDSVLGAGYMLHFDAKSTRGGGTFHLYLGQKTNGEYAVIKASYNSPTGFQYGLPDHSEI